MIELFHVQQYQNGTLAQFLKINPQILKNTISGAQKYAAKIFQHLQKLRT